MHGKNRYFAKKLRNLDFTDLAPKQKAVETALRKYSQKPHRYSEIINKAMDYSLFAGGKRFRPMLLLMSYEAFNAEYETALPSACAIECIHTYSLIHDDLPSIDNDDFRRGKLTCHKKYGEAIALLAGDALFAQAFDLVASQQEAAQPVLVSIIKELAQASGASGMVGGQVLDVMLSGKKDVDREELNYIHSNKTGKLIVAAAKIGAKLAGANESELKAIENYADNLGLAFQIHDDILDEIGDSKEMGKSVGSDRKNEKATYPAYFGLEKAQKKANESIEAAVNALNGIDSVNLRKLAYYVIDRSN